MTPSSKQQFQDSSQLGSIQQVQTPNKAGLAPGLTQQFQDSSQLGSIQQVQTPNKAGLTTGLTQQFQAPSLTQQVQALQLSQQVPDPSLTQKIPDAGLSQPAQTPAFQQQVQAPGMKICITGVPFGNMYSKTCLKVPLKKRQKIDLNDNGSLMKVESITECSPLAHSAILLTCIK